MFKQKPVNVEDCGKPASANAGCWNTSISTCCCRTYSEVPSSATEDWGLPIDLKDFEDVGTLWNGAK